MISHNYKKRRKKRLTKRERREQASGLPRGWHVDEPAEFAAAVNAEIDAHCAGALAAVKAWLP
jgi:hypothetical protein